MFSLAEPGCREGGRYTQGRVGHYGWNGSGQLVSCHLDMEEVPERNWPEEDLTVPARIRV